MSSRHEEFPGWEPYTGEPMILSLPNPADPGLTRSERKRIGQYGIAACRGWCETCGAEAGTPRQGPRGTRRQKRVPHVEGCPAVLTEAEEAKIIARLGRNIGGITLRILIDGRWGHAR